MAHPRTQNVADAQAIPRVADVGALPADPQANWSVTLVRDGSGYVTDIQLTKDTITYNADVTRDGNNKITNISVFSVV